SDCFSLFFRLFCYFRLFRILSSGVLDHSFTGIGLKPSKQTKVCPTFSEVKNLFVVDGSCFVSSGCVNPTLTILTPAMSAGEYAVEQFKRG
ncbi:MAG TPA: GMC oxidoreductase, partial [Blastocatellia bacterium]|nr:GMC oxidoreductase [Blastocatellia bacterium]